jgi:hypothetical protein
MSRKNPPNTAVEAVRGAEDPDAMLLTLFQSTYDVAADLGGWDRRCVEACP